MDPFKLISPQRREEQPPTPALKGNSIKRVLGSDSYGKQWGEKKEKLKRDYRRDRKQAVYGWIKQTQEISKDLRKQRRRIYEKRRLDPNIPPQTSEEEHEERRARRDYRNYFKEAMERQEEAHEEHLRTLRKNYDHAKKDIDQQLDEQNSRLAA